MSAEKTGGRWIGVVAVGVTVGLFVFIGLRVKETLADRAALQQQLAATTTKGTPKRAAAATTTPEPMQWRPTIVANGSLAPIQDADVGFKTGGRLQAVDVKIGDVVKKDQQLGTLDVTETRAQVAAAQAGVKAAQVAVDMAKDADKRTEALFNANAVAEAERTNTASRRALALAQLEQARAQANLAGLVVANGTLTAPFGGLVTRTPTGIGRIVGPGEPLFHLEDTSVLKFSATLGETEARLVQVGADITIEDAKGKVTVVLASLDPMTRRVPIQAEIPNDPPTVLRAGGFVRATLTSDKPVNVLKLPPNAMRAGSQDEVVLDVKGRAHLARVAFATDADGSLLVLSGLEATDRVVLDASAEVREGQPINDGASPQTPPQAIGDAPDKEAP